MSWLTAALLILVVISPVWAWRRQRATPWHAALAGTAAVGVVIVAAAGRVKLDQLNLGPLDIAILVVAAVLVGDATGISDSAVHRVRIALRGRERDYDLTLFDLVAPIDRLVRAYPQPPDPKAYEDWRQRIENEVPSVLERLARLQPPSDEWARVTRGYVELYSLVVDQVRAGGGSQWHHEEIERIRATTYEAHKRLQAEYPRRAR
jgi:hypothetical protein